MLFSVVTVLVLFSPATLSSVEKLNHEERSGGRIVGGNATTIENRPYQVALEITNLIGTGLCGGSIISNTTILTAAHCLVGALKIKVRSGSSYFRKGGTQSTTSTYRFHYKYNPGTNDYDVGVVLLDAPLELNGSTMKAVPLAPAFTVLETGQLTVVSGWGTTRSGGEVSDILMEVTVPIVNRTKCSEDYASSEITITERMICAGEGGKDSCQGDSGGPLVDEQGVQYGIVSFGKGCADPDYPGVYSNIPQLRDWILEYGGV